MKTLLIAALTATGLLACACSSQGPAAAPQATITVTATPSHHRHHHPAATPTPTVSAVATSSPAPAAAPGCLSRYLNASPGVSQGAAGSTYVVIVFKNLSNVPCTLYGYPGVSFGGGHPVTQVGLAAAENAATPREMVTLAPGGFANALLQIAHAANYPAAACHPVTTQWLQVIPPNQTIPLYVQYVTQACTRPVGLLAVDAVRPGAGSGA